MRQLQEGDRAFLHGVDYQGVDLSEAERIIPGGTYYMALVYRKLGRPEVERALWETAWKEAPDPWRREAGLEWLRGEIYWNYGRRLESDDLGREIFRELGGELSAGERAFLSVFQRRRGQDPAWKEGLLLFFADYDEAPLTQRAFFYLESRDLMNIFSAEQQRLIRGRRAAAEQNWKEAYPLLRLLLEESPEWRRRPGLILALRRAALGAGGEAPGETALLLEEWAAQAEPGPDRAEWRENAGRLRRSLGSWGQGAENFRGTWRYEDALQKERGRDVRLWFYLDTLFMDDPRHGLSETLRLAPLWQDKGWYDDLVEKQSRYLLARRDYAGLRRYAQSMAPVLSPSAFNRLAWLDRRLPGGPLLAGGLSPLSSLRPGYYSLLSRGFSGDETPVLPTDSGVMPEEGGDEIPGDLSEEPLSWRAWGEGFFLFSLEDDLLVRVLEDGDKVFAPETLRRLADHLSAEGNYYDAIRVTARLFRQEGFQPLREDWERLYPRPFASLVEPLCREYQVPEALFYGLLRQESLFHPSIVSYAGAVGLAQIMPSTGEWLMDRWHLPGEMNLTDPALNLTLGVRFLADLLGRMESPAHALMAYNAGSGRVRRWEAAYQDFPADVAVEAVPLDQPRGYVKHILASTLIYGYLYEDLTARDAVSLIFPPEVR